MGSGIASAAADTNAGARMACFALESFMTVEFPCGPLKLELQQVPVWRLFGYTVGTAAGSSRYEHC